MTPAVLMPPSGTSESSLNGMEEALYEIVNGQRVELPPMSATETGLATTLGAFLLSFAREHGLGRVFVEALFRLSVAASRSYRPDVAYLSYQRWPRTRPVPEDEPWQIVPELMVEVVSRTNKADDILDRVHAYFAAGVQLFWVIYPRHRQVYVYDSPVRIRVLGLADTLDGGTLLPGFQMPVAILFEDVPTEDVAPTPSETP